MAMGPHRDEREVGDVSPRSAVPCLGAERTKSTGEMCLRESLERAKSMPVDSEWPATGGPLNKKLLFRAESLDF